MSSSALTKFNTKRKQCALVNEIFKWPVLVMRLWGLLPLANGASKTQQNLHDIYFYFVMIFGVIGTTVAEIVQTIKVMPDVDAVTDASFVMTAHIALCYKCFALFLRRSEILAMIDSYNEKFADLPSEREKQVLSGTLKTGILFINMYFIWASFAVVSYPFMPLLEYDPELGLQLPMPSWYPISQDTTPKLALVYGYQCTTVCLCAYLIVAVDCIVAAFMIVLAAEIDLLCNNILSINEQARAIVSKRDEADSNLYENICIKLLNKNVEKHNAALRFADDLNDMFGLSLMVQFGCSIAGLCITLLKLTLTSSSSLQFWTVVAYQTCLVIQIFMYCWFANELKLKSIHVASVAFECGWEEHGIVFQKQIIYIMMRAQEAIEIYAANLFSLSLDVFVSILRLSYSYYAVLRQMSTDQTE